MAAQYIHVKIGLIDAVYPVLGLITTGAFNGFYHFRTSPTTTAWTHKQWCTPCTADGKPIADTESQDTDWRKFLRDHWDTERNHCKVEYFAEFYRIFRRAAAAYINKQNYEQDKNESNYQHGAHEPRRTDTVHDTSGRQRPAASLPTRDTTEVRTEAGKQMKPAQQQRQPKKKARFVELSLFD